MKNRLWNKGFLVSGQTAAPALQPGHSDADYDMGKDKVASIPTTAFPEVRWTTRIGPGPNANIQAINEAVEHASAWVTPLRQEIGHVIVGQQRLLDRLLVSLITNAIFGSKGAASLAR
jgi:hypothetical protein